MKIKIDLAKIDRSKIVERKYTTQDGVEHTAKEYSLDVIPLKAPKFIAESKDKQWQFTKTHFLAEPVSKEEKEKGVKGNIVGDAIEISKKDNFDDIADSIKIDGDRVINTNETPF